MSDSPRPLIINISIFGGISLVSIGGLVIYFIIGGSNPPPKPFNESYPGHTSISSGQTSSGNETIYYSSRQIPGHTDTQPVVIPKVEVNQQPAFSRYPGAVDLDAEIRRNGFSDYPTSFRNMDFVIYGTKMLEKDLDDAKKELERTQFNKEVARAEVDAVKRKIDTKRAEIRQKVFFLGAEKYSVSDVVDDGDDSSFTMGIRGEAPETYGIRFTFPKGIAKEVVLPIQGVNVDKAVPSLGFIPSAISFRVIGSADSLNELVSNKDNYRVHVWFNNFRCGDAESYSTTNNLNPLADVLKIEIVKVN